MTSEHSHHVKELRGGIKGIDENMKFVPADMMIMSCGTVTLDLERGKMLIVYNTKYDIFQIPKGRRNVGESMIDAAFRETYEETGWHARPLRVIMTTRASLAKEERGTEKAEVTEGNLGNEPIGACTYVCPQSEVPGVLKTVYYYPATADSTAERDMNTQEEHEKLEPMWIPISEATEKLTFQAERNVVERLLACVQKSGYSLRAGKSSS
ncbi:NUDIX hydrolase domain-like protein [Cladorrhinum samala]|uniref:NUDIX hydrolase domain-like protein n=1 Tax=Cladorrhinum samala TaxID=585594 RepID=A0AAV9HEJ5_9PEZI|nr:NUDIX hydrolase domain-like protein [Cladorrhinum samala]